MNSKTKYALIILGIAIFNAFPFFNIKYFETGTSLKIIYNYLLIPLIIVSFLGMTICYFKFLKKYNPPTNSKAKKITQNFFNIFLGGISVGLVLFGIILSTIITTNAYLGTSKNIEINAEILKYITGKTKFGRTTHQIEFVNPNDGQIIRLEVYKKFNVGDTFTKEMKIGYWNQLYSKN